MSEEMNKDKIDLIWFISLTVLLFFYLYAVLMTDLATGDTIWIAFILIILVALPAFKNFLLFCLGIIRSDKSG
ncbi:MAG TPA: hypothetical protein ENI51_05815 [Candidatus Atribacteria bacterium]|nr:hypothetical protein [Candidatus Atribacteria bacterium]